MEFAGFPVCLVLLCNAVTCLDGRLPWLRELADVLGVHTARLPRTPTLRVQFGGLPQGIPAQTGISRTTTNTLKLGGSL